MNHVNHVGPGIYGPNIDGRPGYMLAEVYGYGQSLWSSRLDTEQGIQAVADAIPAKGKVGDVGAGNSSFGADVCRLRPDILWINIDPLYSVKPDLLAAISEDAPENLEFCSSSILALPDDIQPGSFSNVFSYWMLSHISRYDRAIGLVAARNMLTLLDAQNGHLAAGPMTGWGAPKRLFSSNAIHMDAPQDATELELQAKQLVKATNLVLPMRMVWRNADKKDLRTAVFKAAGVEA